MATTVNANDIEANDIEEALRDDGHISVALGKDWGGGPRVSAQTYRDGEGFHIHIQVMKRGDHVLDAEANSYAGAAQKVIYYIEKFQ